MRRFTSQILFILISILMSISVFATEISNEAIQSQEVLLVSITLDFDNDATIQNQNFERVEVSYSGDITLDKTNEQWESEERYSTLKPFNFAKMQNQNFERVIYSF